MKKEYKDLLIIFIALLIFAAGWWLALPSATWRYKLTVNVETPEGMKSGSTVREVHVQDFFIQLPESHPSHDLKGEAVVVDLGKRGVLFAPMDTNDYMTVYNVFPMEPGGGGGATRKGFIYYTFLKAGPKDLTPEQYPRLITFKDITDPRTVELVFDAGYEKRHVDEGNGRGHSVNEFVIRSNNFEKLFGKGVKLHSITIEMTDEAVTWGIEKWLPWLNEYRGKLLDGSSYHTIDTPFPLANNLGAGSFSTGENK